MRIVKKHYKIRGKELKECVRFYDKNKIGVTLFYPNKKYALVQSYVLDSRLNFFETPYNITDESEIECCSLYFPDVLSAQRFLFRNDLIALIKRIRCKKTKYILL